MTFTDSIKTCYKKSFSIKGCASRSEYWWFQLYQYLVCAIFFIGSAMAGKTGDFLLTILIIFLIVHIPANFCVTIRRIHDSGNSGWNFCWSLFPIIGSIIIFIFLVSETNPASRFRAEGVRMDDQKPSL